MNNIDKELEKLTESKKEYEEKWAQAQDEYNMAQEGKAMTGEDFKGKQVERAELVAEQEELDQFVSQMEPEMHRNFDIFPEIKEAYSFLQSQQQSLHVQYLSNRHIG